MQVADWAVGWWLGGLVGWLGVKGNRVLIHVLIHVLILIPILVVIVDKLSILIAAVRPLKLNVNNARNNSCTSNKFLWLQPFQA